MDAKMSDCKHDDMTIAELNKNYSDEVALACPCCQQDEIERLTTAFHIACGTISTMPGWSDKHPQDVVDEYLRLATEQGDSDD